MGMIMTTEFETAKQEKQYIVHVNAASIVESGPAAVLQAYYLLTDIAAATTQQELDAIDVSLRLGKPVTAPTTFVMLSNTEDGISVEYTNTNTGATKVVNLPSLPFLNTEALLLQHLRTAAAPQYWNQPINSLGWTDLIDQISQLPEPISLDAIQQLINSINMPTTTL